jgi:spermidine synthase
MLNGVHPPETARLAETHTPRGELVLRRRGTHLELISNGTFLMDTSGGESERAMARLALDGISGQPRVLVAGLGFGFTLAATLSLGVAQVVLVELEPAMVAWNNTWWPLGRDALRDPRVEIVVADVARYAATAPDPFDAVLIDVDNGPDWTVTAGNDDLYRAGLPALRRMVARPHGRLCVWSAHRSATFEERLRAHFASVSGHAVEVARGEPDVLYLATD